MISSIALALCALVAEPEMLTPPPAVCAWQKDETEEVPDEREEVEELLELLREDRKRQGKRDAKAAQTVSKLAAEFRKSGPRDRRDIAKELYRTMLVKRRTNKDGWRQRTLFFECAKALGRMAPESVPHLLRLIDARNHKEDYEVRCAIIAAVGATRDKKAVDPLLDLLDEFQARLQAAAVKALGNFDRHDQKVRKEIFKELLKLLGSASAALHEERNDTTRDRWNRISGPTQDSLRRMSGARQSGYEAWQRWWNKNKRRNWDE